MSNCLVGKTKATANDDKIKDKKIIIVEYSSALG
jgi:hypothetical protein